MRRPKAIQIALKTLQTDAYIGNAGQQVTPHDVVNGNRASRTAMKLKGIDGKGILIDTYALATHISFVIGQ